jgi:hypothetical protein
LYNEPSGGKSLNSSHLAYPLGSVDRGLIENKRVDLVERDEGDAPLEVPPLQQLFPHLGKEDKAT